MRARTTLEAVRDNSFVRAWILRTLHGPARLVGIKAARLSQGPEASKMRFGCCCLRALKNALSVRLVISLVAKFALHNARNFAQVDGGIQLFHIDDTESEGMPIALRPATWSPSASSRLRRTTLRFKMRYRAEPPVHCVDLSAKQGQWPNAP